MKKKTAMIIASLVIFYIASTVLNLFFKNYLDKTGTKPDIIQSIFGGLRDAVADWSFLKAEEYNHRGLSFLKVAEHAEWKMLSLEASHRDYHPHYGEEKIRQNLYSKLYSAVKICGDYPLTPAEEGEILPWFYIQVKFNPHDIRGYVLGAYWLQRVGKTQKGLEFLREGERNNPQSARISAAIGKFYYIQNNAGTALQYLERSRLLWLEEKTPDTISDQYAHTDYIHTFEMLADIYAKRGDYKKAVQVYTELYNLDSNPNILEKIAGIRTKLTRAKQ